MDVTLGALAAAFASEIGGATIPPDQPDEQVEGKEPSSKVFPLSVVGNSSVVAEELPRTEHPALTISLLGWKSSFVDIDKVPDEELAGTWPVQGTWSGGGSAEQFVVFSS